MSRMDEDIARGCLANGEPLDALYGVGWWTPMPEREPEMEPGECPKCGKESIYFGGSFYECEICGAKASDIVDKNISNVENTDDMPFQAGG